MSIKYNKRGASIGVSLLFLVLFIVGGICLGAFFSWIVALCLGVDLTDLNAYSNLSRTGLLWIQFAQHFGSFALTAILFIKFVDKFNLQQAVLGTMIPKNKVSLLWSILIFVAFMPFGEWLVEWNKEISFPESLAALEQVMQTLEAQNERLIKYITDIQSTGHLILAFFVIAITAGVGEELLFRGILQNYLQILTRNKHLAVWITGFLFSAIHLQFYGFFPRMMLGALFGYLYIWSGSIGVAIFAHILNNGLTLLMIYLNQIGVIEYDMETATASPIAAVISFGVTILLCVLFKKFARKKGVEEIEFVGT